MTQTPFPTLPQSVPAPTDMPRVVGGYSGKLDLAGIQLPCAVVESPNGIQRVLSENGITAAILGSRSGASKRAKKASENRWAPLPIFVAPIQLKPFITNELINGPLKPIHYLSGTKTVCGYDSSILVAVCEVWLTARAAGKLQDQQLAKAQAAENLIRALAQVGIAALIDEATGYQASRPQDALEKLLSKYILEEKLPWAKKFPDEFYTQIYRLKGWEFSIEDCKPSCLGHITNDVVYERLPKGVLSKLQKLNPVDKDLGRRKHRHHQFLSNDVGQPELKDYMLQILILMKMSKTWEGFKSHLDIFFPASAGR